MIIGPKKGFSYKELNPFLYLHYIESERYASNWGNLYTKCVILSHAGIRKVKLQTHA